MATTRSLPVILKKFDHTFEPCSIKAAEVSRKCRILATLDFDRSLKLWNLKNDACCCLAHVKQFKWTLCEDSVGETVQNDLMEDQFVTIKSDNSVEVYSISKASSGLSFVDDAVVSKDLLKGLLHDRGKDWPGNEVDLILARKSTEPVRHEITLLLDKTVVAILSLTKTTTAVSVCFDVNGSVKKAAIVPSGGIITVKRCHGFFFTLFSGGCVLIHNISDFVGSVDLLKTVSLNSQDSLAFSSEERPTFTRLEVSDDLAFLVCIDASSNLFVVNLDEYFEEFPSQLVASNHSEDHPFGKVVFEYEPDDEDAVVRVTQMSGVTYGDRVWKTELLAFRRDASKQACLSSFSDVNCAWDPSFKKKWFSGVIGSNDGTLIASHSSCNRRHFPSSTVTGFKAQESREFPFFMAERKQSGCQKRTVFLQHEEWMEKFSLVGVSITPSSLLLNFYPKKISEQEGQVGDDLHGVLCLFSFSAKEYLYHWLSEPYIIVQSFETIYPSLLLTRKSLAVPAFDITQDQLVHKVIMYENAGLADALCFVNQWDHCTIPIHALEVALKLRQLDTVAFFLKNQDKAFTNRCSAALSSSSLLSSVSSSLSSSQSDIALGTTDVEVVTEALLNAVYYNMKQQHYQHFTRQLAQMTLSYLHNLMKDGAKLLEVEDNFQESSSDVASTTFCQEIQSCLEFLTKSTVKLRCLLSNMPVESLDRADSVDGNNLSFPCVRGNDEPRSTDKWVKMTDEDIVEDAIVNRQICSAQTYFQSRSLQQVVVTGHKDAVCDGSLSSFISVGLTVVLRKLLSHDVDTAEIMLTNMGRNVLEQLHTICLFTLHRPLRDFLASELESRGFLSPHEKDSVIFVHTLEAMYSQQSFLEAKRNTWANNPDDGWRDLGLLRSSLNLGSMQILDSYIQTGNLVETATEMQTDSNSSSYVELPLAWVTDWDDLSRQRILAERMLATNIAAYSGSLSHNVEITAEALWNYLLSHTNWTTLLDWIRSMDQVMNPSHDKPKLFVGEKFSVKDQKMVLPKLSWSVLSQMTSCHKVVREMILEELTRNGMFTNAQLSDFHLLLHYLCVTQTLFGDTPAIGILDGLIGSAMNTEGSIVSVVQFHQSFIEYCIRLNLANLLYYYLDFYSLCDSAASIKELGLDANIPAWVDMLLKCRLLGQNPKDPDAVFQASLSLAGFVLDSDSPSITQMLQEGHPVMALSSLLYAPNTFSQSIVSAESQTNTQIWQVDEKLLHSSLMRFPKLQSALMPTATSGAFGMEQQDVSVYRLLQGNSPFEISRLFGWQPTNEFAPKGDSPCEMPHFSNELLVSQHAHVETLTFSYYLRHGRPSFAFVAFLGERLKDATLSKVKVQQAGLKAHRVAIQNLTSRSVCAACVAFTEMLGLDSIALRVDIQAASRVLDHAKVEDPEDAIVSELLSCIGKSNQKPERLLVALKSATRNLISKECLDRTSFEAGQHWNLVVLFCRVHKMEFPLDFLQDCARDDKWLPFVCHAQTCQFPKEQVVNVVEHDFSSPQIQEHLHLAFDNVSIVKAETPSADESTRKRSRKRKPAKKGELSVTPSRDVRAKFYSRMGVIATAASQASQVTVEKAVPVPSCSSSAEDEEGSKDRENAAKERDPETVDNPAVSCKETLLDSEAIPYNLFDILFKCQSDDVPWRKLLAHSIALHRSLLSVVAACFQDSKPLDCLCAWLCSTVSPSLLESAITDITELQWHQWKEQDLTSLIMAAVDQREKLAHTLAKGFYIFDPANPMVDFFHFHESFLVHSDYEASQEHLISFKRSYNKLSMKVMTEKNVDVFKIGNFEWLEAVTSQVTKHMLTHCEKTYKQRHLLAMLAKAMFGKNFACKVPDYCELHEVCKVLHGTDTEIKLEVFLEPDSEACKEEKHRVLLSLLNRKHFAQARKFADLVGLVDDHITLKEVEAELESAKNSKLWEIEQGRMALWRKAEDCFRDNSCKPDTVGSFFENQAKDEQLSLTERAMLLGLAVKWFSDSSHGPLRKTPTELKELQKNRWLFKIRAEIEKDNEGTLTRSISHLEFLSYESEMELLSDLKPSHTEAVRHKAVNLKELVQDDDAKLQVDAECPLAGEKELCALENVIGNLLEGCHVTQARWLANLFSHSSLELDVVMSCIHLAQGTRFVDTLDDHIQKLLKVKTMRRASTTSSDSTFRRTGSFVFSTSFTEKMSTDERWDSVSSDWVQVEDIITTMESLAFYCKQGKRSCACIIACYKVAQTLGQEYETIVNKKPLSVLHALLVSGFDSRYKLMDSYIKAIQLDTAKVTQFIADIILNSLRVHSTGEDISGREYSDLTVNASPSCEDITNMIRLCPDYSQLGNRLLDTATSLVNDRAAGTAPSGVLSLEVELLVRAHECHTLACNMEGIATVLRYGRILTSALAETKDYMLMVRLLTGVGRFNEMSYIFDTLFEHEHFELLCRRGIDKENKLKVALLDYLQKQHPDDTDKFSMVAHHFSMYREIAQTLEETAIKQLASLGDCFPERKHGQGSTGKEAEAFFKLNSIMKSFCYASDNYAKVNCWRHSQSCLKNARLVRLQIQIFSSGVTVVNLDDFSMRKFLANHAQFFQSLLVAEAYRKRDAGLWVDAVYYQVVVKGNFNYLHDMRSAIPIPNSLFVDVASKYKNENSRSSQAAANMKRVLGYVSDIRMRYKLANDLNFRDLGTSILEGDGGAFLRDVMVS
ncbi:spatacsin-like isoform X2 [Montipora capricornis]|uniref:spatacsin-like isoform X2 n=1 Tax=Montipora capricornis TaxID=246305 RepID=UPI0035F18824